MTPPREIPIPEEVGKRKRTTKYTRDELKRMIADFTREINHLKKIKNLK